MCFFRKWTLLNAKIGVRLLASDWANGGPITGSWAYIYIYIYKCAVEFKAGPIVAFFFSKISFFLQKVEDFSKKNKQNQQKQHVYKLKTSPTKLRNMLGPVFNLHWDHFLTFKMCTFLFLFLAETPYLHSVFSKKCKIWRNTKKRRDTVCEHTCANYSCQNVSFSAFFILEVFGISKYLRDVFDR